MSEKAVHAGHRARMRERFIKEGLSGFSEHEVLELLLMFAIPQRDVNPLAHRLIDRFGSLSAVLESSPAELTRVDGVGENAAALLSLMPQLMGYYQHSPSSPTWPRRENTRARCSSACMRSAST